MSPLDIICPHCGATAPANATSCWLCRQPLPAATAEPPVVAEIVPNKPSTLAPQPPAFSPTEVVFLVMTVMVVGLLVLVGIGLAQQAPTVAAVYGVILAPAVILTLVHAFEKNAEGEFRWSQAFGRLIYGLAITIGVGSALALATVVALFALCLAAIGGAN